MGNFTGKCALALCRPAVALCLCIILVGCGGGSSAGGSIADAIGQQSTPAGQSANSTGDLSLGGQIIGNSGTVTLSLNAVAETFSGDSFQFSRQLAAGESYIVDFVASSAKQICSVARPAGVLAGPVTDIEVTCTDPVTVLTYEDAGVGGFVTTGDFNGDGFVDIAFDVRSSPVHPTGGNNDFLRVTYGDGQGGFANYTDTPFLGLSTGIRRGHIMTTDNLNNDQMDDLVMSGGDKLQAFLGDASGNMQLSYSSPEFAGSPLYSLDSDRNGLRDFVAIIQGGSILNMFSLYRGLGGGVFDDVTYIGHRDDPQAKALQLGSPRNLLVADFNGDGLDDILSLMLTNLNGETRRALVLLIGSADGTFNYPDAIDVLPDDLFLGEQIFDNAFTEMAPIDIDQDGDLDLVLCSTGSFLQLLNNNSAGGFDLGTRVTVANGPFHVRVADFNNDGFEDLISLSDGTDTAVISYADGQGGFGDDIADPGSRLDLQFDGDVNLVGLDISDLDGDGFPDVIVGDNGSRPGAGRGAIQIVLNPGQ